MEMNGDVSPASRIAALEQRYIELLEKKIDALEAANRSIESRFPLQVRCYNYSSNLLVSLTMSVYAKLNHL